MITDPLRSLEKAGRGGVFFVYGDDDFRKEEVARRLVDTHLDPATRDFNFDSLRGSEIEVESLASSLATPPMMAEWRVVLVRESEALASSARARELLLKVLEAPPPGLALVLLTAIPEGSQARIYQDLKARARVNDVMDWFNTNLYREYGYHLVYPQDYHGHKRPGRVQEGTDDWGKTKRAFWIVVI